MFFKGVRFVKTSDRFIFQNNDQFYNQIAIKNFEIIKKSGLINTDGLFELVKTKNLEKAQKDNWLIVDVRVGIIRKKLLKAILNKRHLVDNVGNSLIIGNGKPYVILKAWTNLQYLYKDFISSVHSYISPTAKILPGAWVIGNSYIGDKCIIGNNSLIRNSFIDDEAVVGYNTEVSSSYVGKKTTLHTNFVGNSIIGNNCHFGYISCTTTLRLDEKNIFIKWRGKEYDSKCKKVGAFVESNCSLGAYVTLMPGVTIGKNSIIKPYALIKDSVFRKSYCYSVMETVQRPMNRLRNTVVYYKNLRKKLDKELRDSEK